VRYIDLELVPGQAGAPTLILAADEARQQLINEEDATVREALLESQRSIWVNFRPVFEQTFGRKCWYTESRNPGTDDDVDHYRPKGRIAEAPDHGGYWWEAFNWRNFRLSCHRANRLRRNPETGETHGKGDRFPLQDEAERWQGPRDACHEHPSLLDPTDPEDPPLLTFDPDGRVAVAPTYADSDTAVERVEASRHLLHLDWPAFVEDRRAVFAEVYRRVLEGDEAEAGAERGEAGAKELLKASARALIRLAGDREPYSRAAIAYIRGFQDRDWVKRAVLPHIPEAG
jgi:hypothetical protein